MNSGNDAEYQLRWLAQIRQLAKLFKTHQSLSLLLLAVGESILVSVFLSSIRIARFPVARERFAPDIFTICKGLSEPLLVAS